MYIMIIPILILIVQYKPRELFAKSLELFRQALGDQRVAFCKGLRGVELAVKEDFGVEGPAEKGRLIHVCVHICVYIYIHMCMYMYWYLYRNAYIYIYIYMYNIIFCRA